MADLWVDIQIRSSSSSSSSSSVSISSSSESSSSSVSISSSSESSVSISSSSTSVSASSSSSSESFIYEFTDPRTSDDLTINNPYVYGTGQADVAAGGLHRTSGKWYFEVFVPGDSFTLVHVGVINDQFGDDDGGFQPKGKDGIMSNVAWYIGQGPNGWGYQNNGEKVWNNIDTLVADSYSNSTIGVAVDIDAGEIYWAKDNVWQAGCDPATATNPMFSNVSGSRIIPAVSYWGALAPSGIKHGFKASELTYSPPSGYSAFSQG